MRPSRTLLLLFAIYCVEVGTFLVIWPWGAGWDSFWVQLGMTELTGLGLHPALRSLVSAFGVLHLVWGAHDIDLWFGSRRAARRGEEDADEG